MAHDPVNGGSGGDGGHEGGGGPARRLEAFFSLRRARPEGAPADAPRWHLQLEQYRQRLLRAHSATPGALAVRPTAVPAGAKRRLRFAAPAVPGLVNWSPIGPSVVLNGQAATRPQVSGRVSGVAVAADGQRVYAGSANGGVWRSDNAGRTWYPLMNAFDLHPTTYKSTSLSIGAIAIHPEHPDRIYVGSGEAGGALDAYFGVGPIVSEDGGLNWRTEPWNAPAGDHAFYALAVDPANPEHVIGATTQGLFRRQSRNEALFPGRPHPPQSYLLRYAPGTGAWDLGYWSAEGHTVFDVKSGGALSWLKQLVFMPFALDGIPHFLAYEAQKSSWSRPHGLARYRVYTLRPDGTAQQLQQGQWPFGLRLLPVELGGTPAFVRYDPKTGKATLEAWKADGTTRVIWEGRQWDKHWDQLVPFTLQGVPHFLAYDAGGVFSDGPAMLYRWSGTGEVTPVWSEKKDLGDGLQLTPFELDGVPHLQTYERATGRTRVARWNPDGSFTVLGREETLDTGLEFTPFLFRSEPRLIGYHPGTGRTSVYRWAPDATRHLLWTGRWDAGRRFMPIQMGYEWKQVPHATLGPPAPPPASLSATSVVAARTGDSTTFYAAFQNGYIYRSTDGGSTWQAVGANMPAAFGANPRRVTLAVQETNPGVLYAQLQNGTIWRYAVPAMNPLTANWAQQAGAPVDASGDPYVGTQGWYDLALAVSPDDVSTLYLGGATVEATVSGYTEYSGAIYRSQVAGGNLANTFLGASAHADIHGFAFTSGQANALWVACDGGVFFSSTPRAANTDRIFQPLNAGLATLAPYTLAQHPTQDAILFSSTQDNGCQRYTGSAAWSLQEAGVFGDSGFAVVDPDPAGNGQNVLATSNNTGLWLSADGGQTFASVAGGPALAGNDSVEFYAPLVPAGAALPQRVAFGTRAPWFSDDFGGTWTRIGNLLGPAAPARAYNITALAFSPDGLTLFAGLKNGKLYSYADAGGGVWGAPADLTTLAGFPAAFGVPVTSITSDPANANSIYVTFGGNLSASNIGWQRVWHCDGTTWTQRSGPSAGSPASLMNIQHNTLVARKVGAAVHLYAGADLGVWHSADGGQSWSPSGLGLPESPVLNLKLFEAAGPIPALLRAATHGRGAFELVLSDDARFRRPVQLYLRRTILDRGLYPAQDGAIDPTDPAQTRVVNHRDGTGLKLILPTGGADSDTFATGADISFATFATVKDQALALRRQTRTRLYIEVHNRGAQPADGVRLAVLLSRRVGAVPAPPLVPGTFTAPPALPAGYRSNIRDGTFLQGAGWHTRFILSLDDLHAGSPEVLSVDLPRDTFQLAGLYCLLVVAHAPEAPFNSEEVDVDTLTLAESQVAMKYLAVT